MGLLGAHPLFFMYWDVSNPQILLLAEYLLSMDFCLDFLRTNHTLHDTLLVDDESSAVGAHIGTACHLFLTPHAEGFYQCLFCVADERERESVFLCEALVRLCAVYAYANHLIALFAEFTVVVAKTASLTRLCPAPRVLSFLVQSLYFFSVFCIWFSIFCVWVL